VLLLRRALSQQDYIIKHLAGWALLPRRPFGRFLAQRLPGRVKLQRPEGFIDRAKRSRSVMSAGIRDAVFQQQEMALLSDGGESLAQDFGAGKSNGRLEKERRNEVKLPFGESQRQIMPLKPGALRQSHSLGSLPSDPQCRGRNIGAHGLSPAAGKPKHVVTPGAAEIQRSAGGQA
jgi:hypothetical protein